MKSFNSIEKLLIYKINEKFKINHCILVLYVNIIHYKYKNSQV